MPIHHIYKWRVLWLGKWVTTRYRMSEADAKISNPEAVKIPDSLEVRYVPDDALYSMAAGTPFRSANGGSTGDK